MKRNIISIFVLMLLLSSTVSSLSIFDNNYKMKTIYSAECPEDFELFIYCGGLDTVKLIFTLQVNSGGEVKYSHFNKTTDTFNLVSEFDFSNQELNQIWDEIVTNTFFDLDNYYAKDSVYGGSFANITVTGNGITHTVQTENINIEGFNNIIKLVNDLTPGRNDLFFDALVNIPPLKPARPSGKENGQRNVEYDYSTIVIDENEDSVYVKFDWGDEISNNWIGPFKSGENITLTHTWNKENDYTIRVKAIDDPNDDGDLTDGNETDWSDPLLISMPNTKEKNRLPVLIIFLKKLIQQYPFLSNLIHFHESFITPESSFTSTRLNNVDPYDPKSGTRGKLDEETCAITIEIYIIFYGNWVDNYWDQHGATFAKKVKEDIENKWNRENWDKDGQNGPDGEPPWRVQCHDGCQPRDPGCTVNFKAIIGAKKNVASNDVPQGGNAQKSGNEGSHWIRPGFTNNDHSHVNAWGPNNNLPQANNGMETTGVFHINDFAGVYAHEAGHLMGLEDHQTEQQRTDANGNTIKIKVPNKMNSDGTWNIMAWPSGWPSQDDINKIVKDSGIKCPCKCCPEGNDTTDPENEITYPHELGHVMGTVTVQGTASDYESGVAALDYRLDWDGGYYEGGELLIEPPENSIDYTLGPINLEPYIDPDDWITITIYAIDGAGNIGEDSVTVIWVEEEEDTIPPTTEKTIGEPNEEEGYIIYPMTPIWLDAIDEGGSGVNYIYYEIAWDSNEDGSYDEIFSETVYESHVEIHMDYWGIFFGLIELRWYAVDNANNEETMHYQQHLVMG